MNDNKNFFARKAFYQLPLWQNARELRNESLKVITAFPLDEKYGLSDQIRRAARSIPACIAEGHGRFTYKDQIHFCTISRGSAMELLNHFIDAYDQNYISRESLATLQIKISDIIRMLNGYIGYLRKK